jgi:hypothetical protein
MNRLQKSNLTITSKISVRSTQSRKYFERTFEYDDLTFDKTSMECNIRFASHEFKRIESFLKEYYSEEYYFEVPSGKLFFTSRTREVKEHGEINFHIFKEEKISYPQKEKV